MNVDRDDFVEVVSPMLPDRAERMLEGWLRARAINPGTMGPDDVRYEGVVSARGLLVACSVRKAVLLAKLPDLPWDTLEYADILPLVPLDEASGRLSAWLRDHDIDPDKLDPSDVRQDVLRTTVGSMTTFAIRRHALRQLLPEDQWDAYTFVEVIPPMPPREAERALSRWLGRHGLGLTTLRPDDVRRDDFRIDRQTVTAFSLRLARLPSQLR